MGGPHDVVVVGSLNVDYRVEVPHRPDAGETVVGGMSNACRAGRARTRRWRSLTPEGSVAMVGDVGDDPDADLILEALDGHGVDVRHVRRLPGTRTGNAYILVTPDGENSIVVAPGANHRVDTARAVQVVDELAPAVVLLQGELRADATAAVLAGAHGRPGTWSSTWPPSRRCPMRRTGIGTRWSSTPAKRRSCWTPVRSIRRPCRTPPVPCDGERSRRW
jgi:ribokinase